MTEFEKQIYYRWYFRPPMTDFLKIFYTRRCEILWHIEVKHAKRQIIEYSNTQPWRLRRLMLDQEYLEEVYRCENNL